MLKIDTQELLSAESILWISCAVETYLTLHGLTHTSEI